MYTIELSDCQDKLYTDGKTQQQYNIFDDDTVIVHAIILHESEMDDVKELLDRANNFLTLRAMGAFTEADLDSTQLPVPVDPRIEKAKKVIADLQCPEE